MRTTVLIGHTCSSPSPEGRSPRSSSEQLSGAGGHTTVVPSLRPLAVLTEAKRTAWDVVVIDGSALGRDALVVLPGAWCDTPIIGIGLQDLRLTRSLAAAPRCRIAHRSGRNVDGLSGPGLRPAPGATHRPGERP